MRMPVLAPTNRYLVAQRDRRWPHALTALLAVAGVILATLIAVGWPRLRSTSIHYQLIGLRTEVRELEREQRRLMIELERRRTPAVLAGEARALGLAPPDPAVMELAP